MADQISTVDGKSVRHHNKRTYEALRKRFNVPDDFLAVESSVQTYSAFPGNHVRCAD